MDQKYFPQVFKKAVSICSKLFEISEDKILSKSSKRNIVDIKKLIVYKFYSLKQHDKDNLVNLISKEFNCGHSSVVYWCNKAKELYFNDPNFRNDYDVFSTELDFYIKNYKKHNIFFDLSKRLIK